MHSGRAAARLGGLTVIVGLLLGVWNPRFGDPLPMPARLWATAALALAAIWLIASAVFIDLRAKKALRRRRSGDPSKR
jgi:hypothetical protein